MVLFAPCAHHKFSKSEHVRNSFNDFALHYSLQFCQCPHTANSWCHVQMEPIQGQPTCTYIIVSVPFILRWIFDYCIKIDCQLPSIDYSGYNQQQAENVSNTLGQLGGFKAQPPRNIIIQCIPKRLKKHKT